MLHKKFKYFFFTILITILIITGILVFFSENYWVNKGINKAVKVSDKLYSLWNKQTNPVNFNIQKIKGINPERPTSLQFGPDRKLYVATQAGMIYRYTLSRDDDGNYQLMHTDSIDLVKKIQNHDDLGNLTEGVLKRQVTGLLVSGTASNPRIFVTSSDPRIGGKTESPSEIKDGDTGLDTNSGMLSELVWQDSTWEKIDLVRGLPRSEENHSLNGLTIDESKDVLYVTVGGNTNAGSPSINFGKITEFALSACILKVDLAMLRSMPVKETDGNKYIYDLPTLDDPERINLPDGSDKNDPFGGNDGLNQAKIIPGGPVQVFAPGYRNVYDIVLTHTKERQNRIYTIDNGPNEDWGGYPANEGRPDVSNKYVPGEPGSSGPGQNDDKVNNLDNLHLVYKPGMSSPKYGGHPNPIRANPASAGLFWKNELDNFSEKPTVDWPPVPLNMANKNESDYQNPGVNDGALTIMEGSNNGLTEYSASRFFNGKLTGDLLTASFYGSIMRIKLNQEGTKVIFKETLAKGFGNLPLDITSQGNYDIFPGTLWVADYGGNCIFVFEPIESNKWTEINTPDDSSPTARHEASFVEAGGKFYLLGGRKERPVNVYDPLNGKWSVAPPIPGGKELNHFQAVVVKNKIYILLAFTGEFPYEKTVKDIYVYDTDKKEWTILPNLISTDRIRGSVAASVFQDNIYITGGSTNGHYNGTVNWTDMYNPENNSWKKLADAPHKRDHFQTAEWNGKIYAMGGRRTNKEENNIFSDTEPAVDMYDITSDKWISLPPSAQIPTPRAGTTTILAKGQIFVIGGESKQKDAHNEVEAFDPVKQRWTKMPGLIQGRHGTQGIFYENCLYIASGCAKQGGSPELTSMERYYFYPEIKK